MGLLFRETNGKIYFCWNWVSPTLKINRQSTIGNLYDGGIRFDEIHSKSINYPFLIKIGLVFDKDDTHFYFTVYNIPVSMRNVNIWKAEVTRFSNLNCFQLDDNSTFSVGSMNNVLIGNDNSLHMFSLMVGDFDKLTPKYIKVYGEKSFLNLLYLNSYHYFHRKHDFINNVLCRQFLSSWQIHNWTDECSRLEWYHGLLKLYYVY